MPKKLVEFLRSLNEKESEEIWSWLDGEGLIAVEEMIMLIALKSHKKGEIK